MQIRRTRRVRAAARVRTGVRPGAAVGLLGLVASLGCGPAAVVEAIDESGSDESQADEFGSDESESDESGSDESGEPEQ